MSSSPRRNGSKERSPRPRSRNDSRSPSDDRNDKRDNGSEKMTQIYIAKLSRKTNESDLKSEFSKFGQIKNIVLKHAYAFIDFEEQEAAERAIKEMNGKSFVNGEDLVVEQSGRGKSLTIMRKLKYDCSARREEKKTRSKGRRWVLQVQEEGSLVSTWRFLDRRPQIVLSKLHSNWHL